MKISYRLALKESNGVSVFNRLKPDSTALPIFRPYYPFQLYGGVCVGCVWVCVCGCGCGCVWVCVCVCGCVGVGVGVGVWVCVCVLPLGF